ncbi:hypothetical protein [Anaerosinus massiliensis]|uniref:hypothetical protein n=1 Tax=Massilibacillus massiliensis TaxID=1806837 RepID=UPI000DA63566|nr:hypothetical protein [Massilibacillus massiliensis]
MRKKSIFLFLCFMFYFVIPNTVHAGPAPNLMKMTILHLSSDGSPALKFPPTVYPYSMNDTTFSGSTLFVTVQYNGYPRRNSILIYNNDTLLSTKDYTITTDQIISRERIVTGYIDTIAIPFDKLGKGSGNVGSIIVKASGINGGNHTCFVSNVVLK